MLFELNISFLPNPNFVYPNMSASNQPSGPNSLRVEQSDSAEQCGSAPCPTAPHPVQPSGSGTPSLLQSGHQLARWPKSQNQYIDLHSVGSWASGADSIDRSKELEMCMVSRYIYRFSG